MRKRWNNHNSESIIVAMTPNGEIGVGVLTSNVTCHSPVDGAL